MYDALYAGPGAGLGEDFSGWNSSYDGQPIPLGQMREWRDATVERVLSLRPRRVLEIGVGTGLLLSALAPGCEAYRGTDISAPVIARLREQVAAAGIGDKVQLRCQPADVADGLPAGYFDTVILNSVVQYFPSAGYLAGVLRQVVRMLAPGGAVFVGDVRNLRLLRALRTAITLGTGTAGAGTARRAIGQALSLERELLLDPGFFAVLAATTEDVASADVRLRRGRHHNELTRHRYDVILRKHPTSAPAPAPAPASVPQLRWGHDITGLDDLAEAITGSGSLPPRLRITGVPNARVAGEAAAARVLASGGSLSDALAGLAAGGDGTAIDPESFHALGERLGYQVAVTWSPEAIDGSFDALLTDTPR